MASVENLKVDDKFLDLFIYSGYLYSASSSPLLLRGASDYSVDSVSELTRLSARGKYKWRLEWDLNM